MAITKHQAATLWANGYRLVDKEGETYNVIFLINEKKCAIADRHGAHECYFKQIGVDYFILARPLSDLTKEITHEGKVPIIPIDFINWKIGVKDTVWYEHLGEGKIMEVIKDAERNQKIIYEKPSEYPYFLRNIISEMHFNIGFPEEAVRPLKD